VVVKSEKIGEDGRVVRAISAGSLPRARSNSGELKAVADDDRLRREDDLVSTLAKGQTFAKYDLVGSGTVKTLVFLQYKGSGEPKSHMLIWHITPSSGKGQAAAPPASQNLCIGDIVEVLAGKRTRAFHVGVGVQADDTNSFSLCSEKQILNLEAPNTQTRTLWVKGIHKIMMNSGRKFSTNKERLDGKDVEERADEQKALKQKTIQALQKGQAFWKFDFDPSSRTFWRSRAVVFIDRSAAAIEMAQRRGSQAAAGVLRWGPAPRDPSQSRPAPPAPGAQPGSTTPGAAPGTPSQPKP